ncbi:hypothetical protein APA_4355 [Pseudanabaena sp. lw0831]|nr:hypothetical protein APA_4355 [Pseudanabaena sp. lw0831]
MGGVWQEHSLQKLRKRRRLQLSVRSPVLRKALKRNNVVE